MYVLGVAAVLNTRDGEASACQFGAQAVVLGRIDVRYRETTTVKIHDQLLLLLLLLLQLVKPDLNPACISILHWHSGQAGHENIAAQDTAAVARGRGGAPRHFVK